MSKPNSNYVVSRPVDVRDPYAGHFPAPERTALQAWSTAKTVFSSEAAKNIRYSAENSVLAEANRLWKALSTNFGVSPKIINYFRSEIQKYTNRVSADMSQSLLQLRRDVASTSIKVAYADVLKQELAGHTAKKQAITDLNTKNRDRELKAMWSNPKLKWKGSKAAGIHFRYSNQLSKSLSPIDAEIKTITTTSKKRETASLAYLNSFNNNTGTTQKIIEYGNNGTKITRIQTLPSEQVEELPLFSSGHDTLGKSHFNDPHDKSPDRVHGNSRTGSDASIETKNRVMDEIIQQARAAGLGNIDISNLLAIATQESGFNPDAAATTTSASGVFQVVDRTVAFLYDRVDVGMPGLQYDSGRLYRYDVPGSKEIYMAGNNRFDYKLNIGVGIGAYLNAKYLTETIDKKLPTIENIYDRYHSNTPKQYLQQVSQYQQDFYNVLAPGQIPIPPINPIVGQDPFRVPPLQVDLSLINPFPINRVLPTGPLIITPTPLNFRDVPPLQVDPSLWKLSAPRDKPKLENQVDGLVSAMAAFAPPTAGQTLLPDHYQTTLNPVISANWR